jgi:signal transduction histidine kinase
MNFSVDSSDFIYSNIDLYGRSIRIGTAFKFPSKQEVLLERILYGWLLTLWVLVFFITWQVHRFKKLNFELNKLNNTKNKFFSIIGHDLKGPLNSLTSFSGLLINHTSSLSKEEIQMLAKDLDKSLKNLFALLDNLLQWSRSQTGNIDFTPEKFDVTGVLNENKALLQKQAENKGIEIEVIGNMPIQVTAHLNSISTVIRNLLSNAIKFTDNGGKIELNIIDQRSKVIVRVRDSGVGMSKAKRHKIFDLGSSSSTLGTDKEQGTGLGLILCKELVEKNGGRIWLESEQGVGTTFYFTVPK